MTSTNRRAFVAGLAVADANGETTITRAPRNVKAPHQFLRANAPTLVGRVVCQRRQFQAPTSDEEFMPVDTRLSVDFHPARSRSRRGLRDLIHWAMKLVVAVLSAPRGDQGGWEAGARGL